MFVRKRRTNELVWIKNKPQPSSTFTHSGSDGAISCITAFSGASNTNCRSVEGNGSSDKSKSAGVTCFRLIGCSRCTNYRADRKYVGAKVLKLVADGVIYKVTWNIPQYVCCSQQWKTWASQGCKWSVSVLLPQNELQGMLAWTALATSYLFVMCWCQGEGCASRRYGQICSSFHYAMCGYQQAKFWGFVVFGLQMECSISYGMAKANWNNQWWRKEAPWHLQVMGSCAPKITKCKLSLMVKEHTLSVVVYKPQWNISPPPVNAHHTST